MISQVLPRITGAISMTRVSEFGTYSELDSTKLTATSREPLSGIYPEAFELALPAEITLETALHLLGYACLLHKSLMEVLTRHSGKMPGATVSILTSSDTFQAVLIIRKFKILFILPPQTQNVLA